MPLEQESPLINGASNDTAAGTPDSLNSNWLTASLSSAADVDYFKVVTTAASLILIDQTSQQVGSTALWKLGVVNGNGDYLTTLSSSVSGSPTVKTAGASSDLTLTVQGLGSSVPVGSRFTLVTSGADTTIYTVVGATALSGGESTLSLDRALGASVSQSTALQFDPAQLSLAGGSNALVAEVDAAGTYYVRVDASTWTAADYQLKALVLPTVESTGSNDTAAQASASNNRLLANAWMAGTLSSASDVDAWVFTTATMPSDLTIDFAAASGDPVSSKWQIQVQQLNANGQLVAVRTASGSTLAALKDSAASSGSGTAATFSIQKAVSDYAAATTFVVTVSAVSASAYSASKYQLRLSGTSVDLNDAPVITVDTVTGHTPGALVDTGVVRAVKASTNASTSTVKIADLFSVTDADAGQTIASYRLQLTKASGETGTVSGKIVLVDASGNVTDKGALGAAITLTAAEMAQARISLGTDTGNLTLALQALDSTNAPDGSGQSSVMLQTLRVVDPTTGVTISHGANLALVEGSADSSEVLSIQLSSKPAANVDVYLEQSSDNRLTFQSGSATATPSTKLTFTAANYSTAQTVTVKAIDNATVEAAGHPAQMSVRVVSTDTAYDGNNPAALTFSLTDPPNSPPTGAVTVGGTGTDGKAVENLTTLKLDTHTLADAEGLGTLSYQWQRSLDGGSTWSDITGAQSDLYTPGTADGGQSVRAVVSYVDGAGVAQSMNSSAVAVTNVNDAPTGSVTISGTATQGQTLTASNTLADADGIPTSGAGAIAYQWYADGTAIKDATSDTLTLAQAQVGKAITVKASYTDSQGTPESVGSTGTAAVANVNDAPAGAVAIGGTPTQGQTLTASNTLADADGIPTSGAGAVTYQWYADGAPITDATSDTLTLTQAQVGKAITVAARYTDLQGTAESVTSAATAKVANVNDAPTGVVTIGGAPTQGQTLTASNSLADADGMGAIAYQWYAGGVAITDATSDTLTLTQAQVGKAITVVARYTDGQGTAESVSSAATATVANVDDGPAGSVTIAGTPTQGQTLTATNTLTDADGIPTSGAGAIAYQWYADGTAIGGATGSTLVLAQAQVGKTITVKASYTDLQGTATSVGSTGTAVVANVNDAPAGAVAIGGTPTQGQTLTASNTLADADGIPTSGAGAVTYQWYADGAAIAGATAASLVLAQAQVGKAITVAARYTDLQGTAESVTSAATAKVANVNDAPTGVVTIGGAPTQGQTLTVSNSLADADGMGAIAYQWYADGAAIAGATAASLVLAQAQVGKAITVKASYTDGQGTAEGVTSAATARVANVNDAPTGSVTITGTPTQGQTLTAANTLADADGLGAIGYQWYADGTTIVGATASTLVLAQAQVGKAITVKAGYTDGQGTVESVASAATDRVTAVSPVVEQNVPPIGSVAGDGNGDGIADAQQANVASTPFALKGSAGSTTQVYVTLVADSTAGKAATVNTSVITQVEQHDAPADIPAAMSMPMGLIGFAAEVSHAGASVPFSLYVDASTGANGYWKKDAHGTWVNLASTPLGGSVNTEGGKIRLDFQITDGGPFDGDGLVNGVIVDPGAVGYLPASLVGYHPDGPANGLWF